GSPGSAEDPGPRAGSVSHVTGRPAAPRRAERVAVDPDGRVRRDPGGPARDLRGGPASARRRLVPAERPLLGGGRRCPERSGSADRRRQRAGAPRPRRPGETPRRRPRTRGLPLSGAGRHEAEAAARSGRPASRRNRSIVSSDVTYVSPGTGTSMYWRAGFSPSGTRAVP